VIVFDTVACAIDSIDAVQPMGVCLPGQSNRWDLFFFILFPLLFSTTMSTIFLLWTLWLIQKTIAINREAQTTKAGSSSIQDLSIRLAFYSVGVTCTLLLLTVTACVFFAKQEAVKASFQVYVYCEIENYFYAKVGVPEMDCIRTHTMPVFWFVTWIVAAISAVVAQLILSCHVSSRDRLIRVATNVGSQMKDVIEKIETSHYSSQHKGRKVTDYQKGDNIPQQSPRSPREGGDDTMQKDISINANVQMTGQTSSANATVPTKSYDDFEASNAEFSSKMAN